MNRLLLLFLTLPLMAQRPDLRYRPISGPTSTVTIPAGGKYMSGNPPVPHTCGPKPCVVIGTVWIKKQPVAQSFAVKEGNKTTMRHVESVHPEDSYPPCKPGTIRVRHDPVCMIDPSKMTVPKP
jgi:hypothetical protein